MLWELGLSPSFVFQKYPEYYKIIKNPIDMKMIAQKIQGNMYNSLGEVERDFLLMVKNARTFNEPKSVIYKVYQHHRLSVDLLVYWYIYLSWQDA